MHEINKQGKTVHLDDVSVPADTEVNNHFYHKEKITLCKKCEQMIKVPLQKNVSSGLLIIIEPILAKIIKKKHVVFCRTTVVH